MALLVFAAQMQQLGLGWKTYTLKFEGLANDYIYSNLQKDDPTQVTNYRPISLLPVLSKVIEKTIAKQLSGYFEDNKLFNQNQCGFRPGHSTEHAALELVDKITSQMDNNETPINICLDLSKAFDTIDHNILLGKLKYY